MRSVSVTLTNESKVRILKPYLIFSPFKFSCVCACNHRLQHTRKVRFPENTKQDLTMFITQSTNNKQQKLLSLRFLLRPFMFGPQIQGPAIANKVTPKALSITNEFPKNFMQRGDKRLHPKCSKTNLSKLDSGALCSLLTPSLQFLLLICRLFLKYGRSNFLMPLQARRKVSIFL